MAYSTRPTYRSSKQQRESKAFALAMSAALEAARMQTRGDYNYARLGQIDNDIDGWVGRYREPGRRMAWPAEIWSARQADVAVPANG